MKLVLILVIITVLSGCSKFLDEPGPSQSVLEKITADKSRLEFDTFFRIDTITIESPGEWQAGIASYDRPYSSWLNVMRILSDSTKLVVYATEDNTTGTDRYALLEIKLINSADTSSLYIDVVQLAVPRHELVYGGEGDDGFNSLVWLPGLAIAAGYSSSTQGDLTNNRGGKDFWLVKLDDHGNKIWSRSFGGSNDDVANSLVRSMNRTDMTTSDDGFLLAGYTSSNDGDVSGNNGSKDAWVMKTDTLGNLVWQKTFGGTGDDEIQDILPVSDANLILSGTKNGDQWITKMNHGGDIIWEKTFGSSSPDYSGKVMETEYGYFFTGSGTAADGDVADKPTTSEDAWVVRMNSSGDIIWKSYIGGSGNDKGISLALGNGGNILLFGTTESNDLFPELSGTRDVFMAVFDKNDGTIITKKIIEQTDQYELKDVLVKDANWVILAGRSKVPGAVTDTDDSYEGSMLVIDMYGNVQSTRRIGGPGSSIKSLTIGGYSQNIFVGTSSFPDLHGNAGSGGWYGWMEHR